MTQLRFLFLLLALTLVATGCPDDADDDDSSDDDDVTADDDDSAPTDDDDDSSSVGDDDDSSVADDDDAIDDDDAVDDDDSGDDDDSAQAEIQELLDLVAHIDLFLANNFPGGELSYTAITAVELVSSSSDVAALGDDVVNSWTLLDGQVVDGVELPASDWVTLSGVGAADFGALVIEPALSDGALVASVTWDFGGQPATNLAIVAPGGGGPTEVDVFLVPAVDGFRVLDGARDDSEAVFLDGFGNTVGTFTATLACNADICQGSSAAVDAGQSTGLVHADAASCLPDGACELQVAFLGYVGSPTATLNPTGYRLEQDTGTFGHVYYDSSAVLGELCACDNELDQDGDTFTPNSGDCDDGDATVFPGAPELCDGLDNDCDSFLGGDELDDDVDGFTECDGDCDDLDPQSYPAAVELCDGLDNDCDGFLSAPEIDDDLDGVTDCDGDCDDEDAANFPANPELCDGQDNDCDGLLGSDELDDDGDGFTECDGDCDDTFDLTYPGATELCDFVDNDCDGVLPGADEVDDDGDGVAECEGDCDDADAANFPGNPEICDRQDNDCDGYPLTAIPEDYASATGASSSPSPGNVPRGAVFSVDSEVILSTFAVYLEGASAQELEWQVWQQDVTGAYDAIASQSSAMTPVDAVLGNINTSPAFNEPLFAGETYLFSVRSPSGVFTFSTLSPNPLPDTSPSWGTYESSVETAFPASDVDIIWSPLAFASALPIEVTVGIGNGEDDSDADGLAVCEGDCDDDLDTVLPGAPEICDGHDNNCDAVLLIDEVDVDGDGTLLCAGDCNDNEAVTYPGAPELCDRIDNDCDAVIPADEIDDDGDAQTECEGDCDDADPARYTGNAELCDGIDNDCDGAIGPNEIDQDGDGMTECGGDCDESDATRFAGNPEVCDRVDNDCDNVVPGDELDDDVDLMTECEGDCDDANPARFDGNPEVCDGFDNDCDSVLPADEADADADLQSICEGDCDDANDARWVGNTEICDGFDNDCDAVVPADEIDGDGDGQAVCGGDCDDADAVRFAGNPEVCDGIDNDCDGVVPSTETDDDADGVSECEGDCDDADPARIDNCSVLITSGSEGYGHHGACSGWNGCGSAQTCAQWACQINGYNSVVSHDGGSACTGRSVCHLFNSQNSIDWNWGNWCAVLGVGNIQCQ